MQKEWLPLSGGAAFAPIPPAIPTRRYICALPGFIDLDIAATQTAVALRRIEDAFQLTLIQMPRPGSIVGLTAAVNPARTAGTATFEIYKNSVATGISTVIDGDNTSRNYVNPTVTTGFAPGDLLEVMITTTGTWTPTTADGEAIIWLLMEV